MRTIGVLACLFVWVWLFFEGLWSACWVFLDRGSLDHSDVVVAPGVMQVPILLAFVHEWGFVLVGLAVGMVTYATIIYRGQ